MISSENQPASREFDPAALARLQKIGGRKLVLGILNIFLNQTPERLAVITAAFQTGDFETLGNTAHSLKSSAGNVGAANLQQAAETLETEADRPKPEISADLIEELERFATNAVAYFTAKRKEYNP
ncbi:MAG: Hpt domain-containing protein [Fidelibacterota bacterium]